MLRRSIRRYEHQQLLIGQEGFSPNDWQACIELNAIYQGNYFRVLRNGLQFNQYVGVISVNGLSIEIHPKADKNDDDKKWAGALIEMLRACGRINTHQIENVRLSKQPVNLLHIYFESFLNEVTKLMHQGLTKQYRQHEGNVKMLKGKLDFAGNIRHNLVHKEQFYTTHQVYDLNHSIHQILACALDIVKRFSSGTHIAEKSRQVRLYFPEVDSRIPSAQELNNIQLTRKTAPYKRALELARLIILNYSPGIKGGKESMISLLFDMNQLWEEYVFVCLRRAAQEGTQVHAQRRKSFWGWNFLQPDIVVEFTENGKTTTCIVDTKWKTSLGNSASIQDLRQVFAYAKYWKAERVMLLYPGEPRGLLFVPFEEEGMPHKCRLGFANVVNQDGTLDKKLGIRILEKLALS